MISSSNLGGSTIVTIFKGFTCPANTNFVAFSRYFEGTLSLAAVLIPSLVSELSSLDEKYNKAKYVGAMCALAMYKFLAPTPMYM